MLHLNKKGFAISTVLYGILAVMIVLLISILAFQKSTKKLNSSFSADIENTLNDCVTDEIIIENCYAAGNSYCDHTAYYSCIGIMEETTPPVVGPKIKDKLISSVVTTGNGLYADTNGRYIYKGTAVNNYIKYDNKTWRIVAIESDGSAKIMLTEYSNPLPWDSVETTECQFDWNCSTLNNFLNNTFYNTITDRGKLVKKEWYVGVVFNTGMTDLNEVHQQVSETSYTSSAGTAGTVGLISISDYLKASLADCSTNPLNNTTCTSWITGSMWVINPYKDMSNQSLVQAGVIEGGAIKGKAVTTSINVAPVVFLNKDVTIATGDGSAGSPYKLD